MSPSIEDRLTASEKKTWMFVVSSRALRLDAEQAVEHATGDHSGRIMEVLHRAPDVPVQQRPGFGRNVARRNIDEPLDIDPRRRGEGLPLVLGTAQPSEADKADPHDRLPCR